MSKRYVNVGGSAVPLGGVGFPAAPLTDGLGSGAQPTDIAMTSPSLTTPTAWAEIVSSLSADADMTTVTVTRVSIGSSTTTTPCLLQIGVGAPGSEVVLWTIPMGFLTEHSQRHVPGFIPAGSRVSARWLAGRPLSTKYLAFSFHPGLGVGTPTSYGVADAAAYLGVAVATGATSDVPGSWVTIAASTTAIADVLGVYAGYMDDSGLPTAYVRVDVATGDAGSEVVVGSYYLYTVTAEILTDMTPQVFHMTQSIPVGTRLSVRMTTTDANETLDVVIVTAARL